MQLFKCKSCELGPCYCGGENATTSDAYSGEDALMPIACPFSGENEDPEWMPVLSPGITQKGCEQLEQLDWADDAFERMPDWVRDMKAGGKSIPYPCHRRKAILRSLEK